MQTSPIKPAAKWKFRTGVILTGLLVLFLVFDGVTKIAHVAPVVQASEKLGIAPDSLLGVGLLLLTCTVIYVIPKTAILGAILLTGYLGGATAVHVVARSGWFPVGFSAVFGALVWLGLVLREPRLFRIILVRK